MTTIEKIYNYFEKKPELKVLFIFNDEFLALELAGTSWKKGYRYADFKGDWFTTKYKLDTEWADDKVILYFHQESPLQKKSLQENFPLLDVLTANMEYHHQDYAAFMQQYDLPASMEVFVKKNIQLLQSDRISRLLQSYYADKSISTDVAVRAILSVYSGQGRVLEDRVLEWDNIILKILFYGRDSERNKRTDFYVKLRNTPMVKKALDDKLTGIFGCTTDDNTETKVKKLVGILKYNAIVQNLAVVSADDYKASRITDSIALQQMNRILELALSNPKTAKALTETINELGTDIQDDNIIKWYGTNADYYYIPDGLCLPILRALMEKTVMEEPRKVTDRLRELMTRLGSGSEIGIAAEYAACVARYYECALASGSITLNRPDDYLEKYGNEYYLTDQLYRLSVECFYKISPSHALYETMQR